MRRKKGTGRIFKRGNTYFFQVRINGVVKTSSLQTANHQEAERKAAELIPVIGAKTKEDIASYVKVARKLATGQRLSIKNAWDKYESSPKRPDSSLGTLGNYKRHWLAFVSWLEVNYPAVETVGQITPDIANEYATILGAMKISFNTFNYHIQSLRLVCRILKTEAGLEENPFADVEARKGVQQTRKDFTSAEVKGILASFADEALSLMNKQEMKALFHILAFTGLRLADAVLLKWGSIDTKRGMIVCHPVKTRQVARQVHIPIHPTLQSVLAEAETWKDDLGFVLPHVAGRYARTPDGVRKDCIDIIETNGFKERNGVKVGRDRRKYGVHSFRHFFASQCAMSGVSIALLADILGDNIKTLQKYYLHANDEARGKVFASLPSLSSDTDLQPQDDSLARLRVELRRIAETADVKTLRAALLAVKKHCLEIASEVK